jgi:HPt (histidine-containing phosphotransfer) domain-containing protein
VAPVDPQEQTAEPEGFSAAAALQRLGNNTRLYARQARRFHAQYGDVAERVSEALARNDDQDAANRLHTLRGVAATLGADGLAACAGRVETAVKAGRRGEVPDEIARLGQMLLEAGNTLSTLADALDTGHGPVPGNGNVEVTPDRLQQLATLLEQGNMRAVDAYAELQPALAQAAEQANERMATAMDELDFAGALSTLRELMTVQEVRDPG